jgi:hypothetical protein
MLSTFCRLTANIKKIFSGGFAPDPLAGGSSTLPDLTSPSALPFHFHNRFGAYEFSSVTCQVAIGPIKKEN